jgi:sirohydrochlorin ferrochelatase
MARIGVMVCGHGSRDVAAVDEFHGLVRKLAERLPEHPLESGFLEFARPIIREGLDQLRECGVDHVLAVIGRGTSDPDANGNVAKVARMLWEGMGFGWAEVGYSGLAHPRVDALLERAVRLGFRRIVVFPWFLFTGVLVRRIYRQTEEAAARHPEVELLKAGYLGDHPLVLDCFVERIEGIGAGDVNMNCRLCKYRERVIGHEAAVGLPQQGHHHHVEGIGTDPHPHHHPHRHDHHEPAQRPAGTLPAR